MKFIKKILIVSLVFILSVQLFACGSKDAENESSGNSVAASDTNKDPITGEAYPDQINVGIIEGGPESAILVQEDYLKEIGVKVNAVTYSAGTDINNAVVSGDVDVATLGSSPVSLGIANGIGYKVVFAPYVEGGNIEALVVKKDSGVSTVAGLKGKTIGTPFGTTSHYALLNALELGGLSASDVEILGLGGQDIVAAWTRGDIDAAYIWSPALDECVKNGGSIITNDGELAEQGVLIPEVGVARNEFAEKYPTLVSQYVKALIKVYDLAKNDPDQAAKDVAAWEGIAEENAKGQIADNIWVSGEDQLTGDYLGTSGKKGKLAGILKTIADFHQEQGNIGKSPDVKIFEDAIDPSFVETALK